MRKNLAKASVHSLNSAIAAERSNAKTIHRKSGRPSAEQVSAINQAILAAATQCFLAKGYAGTSMDAIAAAAGISKGTLYNRHAEKDSLLRLVVQDRVAAWSAMSARLDSKLGDTIEKRLKQHGKTLAVWGSSTEVRTLRRLLDGAPDSAHIHNELLYANMVDYLAREIREFTRKDGRPARNPERVATILMATLDGWLRREGTLRTVSQREAINFANHTIDFLIAARSRW